MLTFFDFPAEHWGHLRTSNPPLGDCWQSPAGQRIESVFSTVRHRTVRTKGALSQKTAKLMVFTLIQAASKKWLRLNGRNQLPKVIEGIKFSDGVEVTSDTESPAAC
jgi:putative transposase